MIDLQECPKADIAVAVLIIETLKLLVNEELVSLEDQKNWHEDELFIIFNDVIKDAETAQLCNLKYLALFDVEETCSAGDLWKIIFEKVKDNISAKHLETLEFLLKNGSLSSRILTAIGEDFSEKVF